MRPQTDPDEVERVRDRPHRERPPVTGVAGREALRVASEDLEQRSELAAGLSGFNFMSESGTLVLHHLERAPRVAHLEGPLRCVGDSLRMTDIGAGVLNLEEQVGRLHSTSARISMNLSGYCPAPPKRMSYDLETV